MDDLIKRTRMGDPAAFEQLAERYDPLIRSMTAKMYAVGAGGSDAEDFRQEALLALYSAAMNYREQDEVTFGLYAKICVRNRLVSLIRRSYLESSVMEMTRQEENEENEENADPEQSCIERESWLEMQERIKEVLSDFEQKVLSRYLRGWTYEAIAASLGVTEKSVDNAIYRLKAKLKRLYDRL